MKLFKVILIGFLLTGLLACGGGSSQLSDTSNNIDEGETLADIAITTPAPLEAPTVKAAVVSTANLPAGSIITNNDFNVISLVGTSRSRSGARASVEVNVIESSKVQILYISNDSGEVAFPIFYAGGNIDISSENIIKALIWLNPLTFQYNHDDKLALLAQIETNQLFQQLVTAVDTILTSEDYLSLTDVTAYPTVLRSTVQLIIEAAEVLDNKATETRSLLQRANISENNWVTVLDKPGYTINYSNPEYVAYGVTLTDQDGNETLSLLKGKAGIFSTQWGWPPVYITDDSTLESDLVINDGEYTATFHKGFNTNISNWYVPYIPGLPSNVQLPGATATGTATFYNTFKGVEIIMDVGFGTTFMGQFDTILKRISQDLADAKSLVDLYDAISSGDPVTQIDAITDFMLDNWPAITKAVFDSYGHDSVAYLQAAKGMLKNIAQVLKMYTFVNSHAPFLVDMVSAPWAFEYCFEQNSGVLSTCQAAVPLIPPVAVLSVDDATTYIGSTISFYASNSYDDATMSLLYRFDFDGDNVYDTEWGTSSSATYAYLSSGNYVAKVEVKDADGLVGTAVAFVSVNDPSSALSVGLIIDSSGSMDSVFSDVKVAAISFIQRLNTLDRAAIIGFDTVVNIDQAFTSDKTLLETSITRLSAFGSTALYDGVSAGITEILEEDETRAKALVIIADGDDNASSKNLSEVITEANDGDITLYVIGLGLSLNEDRLKDMANSTRGMYFNAPDSNDLSTIYERILGITN